MGVMKREALASISEVVQTEEVIEDYGILKPEHLVLMLGSDTPVELRLLKLWREEALKYSSVHMSGYKDMMENCGIAKPQHIGLAGELKTAEGKLVLVGYASPQLEEYSTVHFKDQMVLAGSVVWQLMDKVGLTYSDLVMESR